MKRIYPRLNLEGTDLLHRVGVIYSQIINDLLMKVDDGEKEYPKGFLHTSTTRMMTPNYYTDMWSRDVGRGIIELARCGFPEDAQSVLDCIFRIGKNFGDHYGRILATADEGKKACIDISGDVEADGNLSILAAIYYTWKHGGMEHNQGLRYLAHAKDVFQWIEKTAETCPYGFLLASKSELSGNPDTPHVIYAIFASYWVVCTAKAYADMAQFCGQTADSLYYQHLSDRMKEGILSLLVSRGRTGKQRTATPAGVWLNGIGEDGYAAEVGDYGVRFPIHRWTRQLPFVNDLDVDGTVKTDPELYRINEASYRYLKEGMAEGYYFRRYGFVSNTCFSGMGGRHDDTMAGYGQNYFTQAALMMDDVNVYTKCIEGICRLAYDGDVVAPLTPDTNPWVMHECFDYDNYEQARDHSFGKIGDEEHFIMHNPGDEGNLVQSAETLKTFAAMIGIESCGDTLYIRPRMPWECTQAEVLDFPAVCADGSESRISYQYTMQRWKNRFELTVCGTEKFKTVVIRIGPLPNVLCNEEELRQEWTLHRRFEAVFAEKQIPVEGRTCVTAELLNER